MFFWCNKKKSKISDKEQFSVAAGWYINLITHCLYVNVLQLNRILQFMQTTAKRQFIVSLNFIDTVSKKKKSNDCRKLFNVSPEC